MSALIAHAKALRALAKALGEEGLFEQEVGRQPVADILAPLARSCNAAADALVAEARSEMTGNPTKGTTNDDNPR